MEQKIDFLTMPHDYVVCWHPDCPMADNCLRRLAAEHLPAERCTVPSVNLHSVAVQSHHCPMQRPAAMMRVAYGMRHIYDDVRSIDRQPLYTAIWSKLGNTMYYRYRNGKRPIMPEVQTQVEVIFHSFGYTDPVRFDRYEEVVAW